MSVPVKLGSFGLLLVVVLVAAFMLGAAVGPLDDGVGEPSMEMQMDHGGG